MTCPMKEEKPGKVKFLSKIENCRSLRKAAILNFTKTSLFSANSIPIMSHWILALGRVTDMYDMSNERVETRPGYVFVEN